MVKKKKEEEAQQVQQQTTEQEVKQPNLPTQAAATVEVNDIELPKTVAPKVQPFSPTPQKPARLQRKEENAKSLVDTLYAKEQELGRKLTQQEVSDMADTKGLWAYQSLNNKRGNVANVFGARGLYGKLNDDTYKMLRGDLDTRTAKDNAEKAEKNKSNYIVQPAVPVGDKLVDITSGMVNGIKNWGSQITDQNNISPEQAEQLYARLNHIGIKTPEVGQLPTTLYDLIENLGPDADEAIEALGFEVNGVLTLPHNESYDEMMARRQKAEEEMLLLTQQKELDRQRSRIGLAELGAGIGDMIKASRGAIVNPRDYKAMYDSLTAQQQKNFDNYLARMNALKEEEKAKQRLVEERAYNERLLREQEKQKNDLLKTQYLMDLGLEEAKQEDRLELQGLKGTQAMDRLKARLNADQQENVLKGTSVYFEGKNHQITKNDSLGIFGAIYGEILPYLNENANYTAVIAGIQDPVAENTAAKVRTIVSSALNDPTVELSDASKQKIRSILNIGGAPTGGATGNSGTSVAAASVDATPMYQGRNGQKITEAQWNALPEAIKNNYTLVTQ